MITVEVSVQDDKWYNFIEQPEDYIEEIILFSLKELAVANSGSILSVILANDDLLRDLNLKYRCIDKPTNVLSFNYEDMSYSSYLGELFLSLERIVSESEEMDISIDSHLTHMLVHGVLHLLGHDHIKPDEAEQMQKLEIAVLKKRNIANPYSDTSLKQTLPSTNKK